MPRPAYMLCCETQTADAVTGMIIHVNVYNSMQVAIEPPTVAAPTGPTISESPATPSALAPVIVPGVVSPTHGLPVSKMVVTATWMREPGEENAECEFEVGICDPSGHENVVSAGICILEKPFQRIDSMFFGGLPFAPVSGVHTIEARMRRRGAGDEWSRQTYPFVVDVITQSAP